MILGLLRGAGFAGAAALVALVVQSAVESADIGSPPVSLDAIATVKPRIEALAGPGVQIAFFGDSTAVYYTPGRTVPQQLQRALRRGQHVQTIGYDALHPFDVFFLADVVLEARPDAVVRRALAGRTGALVEGVALGAVAALVAYLGGAGSEFIYFQF